MGRVGATRAMCLGIQYPAGSPRWCLEVPYVWQAPRLVRDPFLYCSKARIGEFRGKVHRGLSRRGGGCASWMGCRFE